MPSVRKSDGVAATAGDRRAFQSLEVVGICDGDLQRRHAERQARRCGDRLDRPIARGLLRSRDRSARRMRSSSHTPLSKFKHRDREPIHVDAADRAAPG